MDTPVSQLRAICLAIAGFTCWVLCDSLIKWAGRSDLPNYEIVAFLGIFTMLFVSLYTGLQGEFKRLWPQRPGRLAARSLLDVGNNLFVVVALRHLSLTLFYILIFTSPMLVAILGRVFLKESLDWRKVAAILTGFAGVVVAVYPSRSSGSSEWIGFAACAVCVTCFSVGIAWSRIISQTERTQSMTFFSGLLSAILGLSAMLHYAAPLNSRLLALLLMMGLLGALGSICMFVALKHTTAATVSQYHYSQLVSGALAAYFMFHENPTFRMLLGAMLIISAGLYTAVEKSRAGLANSSRQPLPGLLS